MRKLKLQMQLSIDGFVARTNGEPTNFNWDDEVRNYSIANLEQVDCLILGSKTAKDFIPHWDAVALNPGGPDFIFGKKLSDTPKIVFSKTLTNSEWVNTKLAKGEISDEIDKLKKQEGKDILVYGGAGFASSLIRLQLIDEFHLLVNPVSIGNGLAIFREKTNLKLIKATPLTCGIVILKYEPSK